jgi:hypothetical protein
MSLEGLVTKFLFQLIAKHRPGDGLRQTARFTRPMFGFS